MQVGQVSVEARLVLDRFRKALQDAFRNVQQAADNMSNAMRQGPQNSLDELEKRARRTTSRMQGYFKDVSRIVGGIVVSQAFYKLLSLIQDAGKALYTFRGHIEQVHIAFEQMMGSASYATAYMRELESLAVNTPFGFEDLAEASKRLNAMGFSAKELIPYITMIGDTVAGVGGGAPAMDGIVRALGQIKTKGKVQAQELRQLAEWGVPAFRILQEELGLTGEEVADIGNQGITAERGLQALFNGLNKRFGGLMNKLSDTLPGIIENISDSLKFLGTHMLEDFFDAFKEIAKGFRDWLEQLREINSKGGLGALFEHLVPPELQPSIRAIVASFKNLWEAVKSLASSLRPLIEGVFGGFIIALGAILPPLSTVIKRIAEFIEWATKAIPALKELVAAIVLLKVATMAATWLKTFTLALKGLSLAAVMSRAVNLLTSSINKLNLAFLRNPAVLAVIAGIVAGVAIFKGSIQDAIKWLDALYARILSFMGINIQEVLQPEEKEAEKWEDVVDQIGGIADGVSDVGDEFDKAKKKKDKFLASFDEVYQVPELGGDDKGGGGGGGGNTPGMPPGTKDPGSGDVVFDPSKYGYKDAIPKVILLPELKWPVDPGAMAETFEAAMRAIAIASGMPVAPTLENMGVVAESVRGGVRVISEELQRLLDRVRNWGSNVRSAWDGLLNGLPTATAGAAAGVQQTWDSLLQGLNTALGARGAGIKLQWNDLWNSLLGPAQGVSTGIQLTWNNLLNGIIIPFNTTAATLSTGWNNLFGTLPIPLVPASSVVITSWTNLLNNMQQTLTAVTTQLGTAWNSWITPLPNPIMQTAPHVQSAWNALLTNLRTTIDSTGLVQAWNNMWGNLSTTMSTAGANIQATWSRAWNDLKVGWNTFTTELSQGWQNFGANFDKFMADLSKGMSKAWNEFWGNMGSGVAAGWANIQASWQPVAAFFTVDVPQLFKDVWEGLKGWGASIAAWWEEHKVTVLVIVAALAIGILLAFSGPGGWIAGATAALLLFFVDMDSAFAAGKDDAIETTDEMGKGIVNEHWQWVNEVRAILDNMQQKWNTFWTSTTNRWTEFKDNLGKTWGSFWSDLKNIGTQFTDDFSRGWSEFYDKLKRAWDNFDMTTLTGWKTFWNNLTSAWKDFSGDMGTTWSDMWNSLGTRLNTFVKDMVSEMTGFIKDMKQFGRDLVDGLWNGISDKVDWLVDQVSKFSVSISNAIRDHFQIQSPSRLMRSFGEYIAEGLAEGINAGASKAVEAATSMAGAISNAVNTAIDAVGRLSGINFGGGGGGPLYGDDGYPVGMPDWLKPKQGSKEDERDRGRNPYDRDDKDYKKDKDRYVWDDDEGRWWDNEDGGWEGVDKDAFKWGLATGGRVKKGGPVWVGEKGPELLNLPDGAEVVNNQTSTDLFRNIVDFSDTMARLRSFANNELMTRNTQTASNGMQQNQSVIAHLDDASIRALAASMLQGIERLPLGEDSSGSGDVLQVGILVADDRGLQELDRRLRALRNRENTRGGGGL